MQDSTVSLPPEKKYESAYSTASGVVVSGSAMVGVSETMLQKGGGGGVNVEQHSGMRCRANSIQSRKRSYRRQFKIFDGGSQKYKKQIVSSKVIFFPRHCPFRVSFCLITTKNLCVIRKLNFLKCKTFKFSSWVELLTF